MDWSTHDHLPRSKAEAQLEHVETYWRVLGSSLKELACATYRTTAGLELRCGYSVDHLLRSRRARVRG